MKLFLCWEGGLLRAFEDRVIIESRRDSGGDNIIGDELVAPVCGELLREFGGVRREPPRRTWQFGQILTKREMSSLGTLGR